MLTLSQKTSGRYKITTIPPNPIFLVLNSVGKRMSFSSINSNKSLISLAQIGLNAQPKSVTIAKEDAIC